MKGETGIHRSKNIKLNLIGYSLCIVFPIKLKFMFGINKSDLELFVKIFSKMHPSSVSVNDLTLCVYISAVGKPTTKYDNCLEKDRVGSGQHDMSGISPSDGKLQRGLCGCEPTQHCKGHLSGECEREGRGSSRRVPYLSPIQESAVSYRSSQSRSDASSVISRSIAVTSSVSSSSYTTATSSHLASVTSHSSLANQASRDVNAVAAAGAASASSSSVHSSLSQHTLSQNTLSQHTISHPSRSEHSQHSRGSYRQRDSSHRDNSSRKKREGSVHSDDTLDGTLTPSGASGDELQKSGGESSHSLSADRSLVLSSRHKDESDVSLSSMSEDEQRPTRPPLVRDQERVGSYGQMPPLPLGGRLGPESLSNRLTAELNLYEGQEEMLRQIADVERVRASALAQQESVAVAQVNKVNQHSLCTVKMKMVAVTLNSHTITKSI